jgi:hypothetical protein
MTDNTLGFVAVFSLFFLLPIADLARKFPVAASTATNVIANKSS